MNNIEQAQILLDDNRPMAALVHALIALVEEQQTTNDLLRQMINDPVDYDEGTDWAAYQHDDEQPPSGYNPELCCACEHSRAHHIDSGCDAVIDVDSGQRCGCPEFDDIPF